MPASRCHGLGLDAKCAGCIDCCGRESCPGCAFCDSRDDGASSSPEVSPGAAGAAKPARAAGVGGTCALPTPAVRQAILDAVSELRRQSLTEVAPTSTSLLHVADRLLGVLDSIEDARAAAVSTPDPTLRDRFAMAALTGLSFAEISDPDRAASWAYKMADAMLAARGGK